MAIGNPEPRYWLVPCGPGRDGVQPIDQLHRWLQLGFWGLRRIAKNRVNLHAGDYVCFYASKLGVAASGRVSRPPLALVSQNESPEPLPLGPEIYKLPLVDIIWLPTPRAIDPDLRRKLDAFRGMAKDGNFGWFVQTTHAVSVYDFRVLTSADSA